MSVANWYESPNLINYHVLYLQSVQISAVCKLCCLLRRTPLLQYH